MGRPRGAARLCTGLALATAPVAQLSVPMEKLPGFAPVSEMEVMPSDELPVFESVKVWAELVVAVVTLPKSAVGGESVACGAVATLMPFPERATVKGDSGWSRSWIE